MWVESKRVKLQLIQTKQEKALRDQEFVTLANDTANYYYKIPVIKFFRVELNGHFNVEYDQ